MDEKPLTISEFARLSGIPRKTLIFYDEAGVFSPAGIGANHYRHYSRRQLQVANVILALRGIDVSLTDIKDFLAARSPKALAALCQTQEERVTTEIAKLESIREVIRSLNAAIQSTAGAKPGTMEVRTLPETRLFIGPKIGSKAMQDIDNALIEFYELCARQAVPQTHPLGSVIVLDGAPFSPDRFYCPAGPTVPDRLITQRPAGKYLVGYARGDYGKLDGLYKKILRYARRMQWKIIGDAYEEYLVNELASQDPDSYLARVAVRIEENS